jgi:threonine/homoserine efflux transporter RhtA
MTADQHEALPQLIVAANATILSDALPYMMESMSLIFSALPTPLHEVTDAVACSEDLLLFSVIGYLFLHETTVLSPLAYMHASL